MKKILLIITLFIGVGSVHAQFNSSWNETTGFLETYTHLMYNYNSSSCQSEYNEIRIEGQMLFAKFKFRDGSGEVTSKVDLSKLKNIIYNPKFFTLEFNGDFIESSYDNGIASYSNKLDIHLCNAEFLDRVFRAFNRLAELASEKRK